MSKTRTFLSSGQANKAKIVPWINQTTIITPIATTIGHTSTTWGGAFMLRAATKKPMAPKTSPNSMLMMDRFTQTSADEGARRG
jgi:hypothetical protein